MKKIILSLAVLASVALVSCGNGAKGSDTDTANKDQKNEQPCPNPEENKGNVPDVTSTGDQKTEGTDDQKTEGAVDQQPDAEQPAATQQPA